MKIKQIIALFMVGIFILGLGLSSCKKKDPKPTLPPRESMVQDLSIGGGSKSMDSTQSVYNDAAFRVGVWNLVLFVTLVVPVTTFGEAFSYDASWENDIDAWVWSYQKGVGLKTYDCELQAYAEGDSVHWKMYVSHDTDFSDFLWYEGWSEINNNGGRWVMYESPTKTNELLAINWSKNNIDNTVYITYTNVCPSTITPHGTNNGSYISYGTQTGAYNRFYTIHNEADSNTTYIEWNFGDETGRIKDTKTYNDVWYCWDENQYECDCAK